MVSRFLKCCVVVLLAASSLVACSGDNETEPGSSRDLPYSPTDLLVTQEEQIALAEWCEEHSTFKDLDCEREVGKVALAVGFRETRGDEQCWVELFADRITGKFGIDEGAYELRAQACADLGLTLVGD